LTGNGVKSNGVSIKLNIKIINIYFVRLRKWLRTKLYLGFPFIFTFFYIYFTLTMSFDLKNIIVVFTKINEFIRVYSFVRFCLSELAVFPPSPKWPEIQSLNKNELNINSMTLN